MLKQTYLTPSVQTIELRTDYSELLMVSHPTQNPYYDLYYDGEDEEFV